MLYYSVTADILTDVLSNNLRCLPDPSLNLGSRHPFHKLFANYFLPLKTVISIPILLLRRTSLSTRQKLSIGIVLCLSTVMIAIALIRGISARVHGTADQIWSTFWVQFESCVATTMVSLSAFRQLFVSGGGPDGRKKGEGRGAQVGRRHKGAEGASHRRRPLLWYKRSEASEGSDLPRVDVGATMTGMRTVIRESGRAVFGRLGLQSGATETLLEEEMVLA